MIKLNDIKETRIDTSEILCYNLDDGIGKHILFILKNLMANIVSGIIPKN